MKSHQAPSELDLDFDIEEDGLCGWMDVTRLLLSLFMLVFYSISSLIMCELEVHLRV